MLSASITAGESACTGLCVNVRKAKGGPVLVRKTVSSADLLDHQAEAWHSLHLRQGRPDVVLEDVKFDLRPIHESGNDGRLSGFALVTAGTNGKRLSYRFTIHAVEHIATGASLELIESGALQPGDEYYYDLCAVNTPQHTPIVNDKITITKTIVKLQYLKHPLRPLLETAEKIGPQDKRWAPVFYTRDALMRAEKFARRGGTLQPAIETGCILVGILCSCPHTGEFFVVVRDGLEAQDANSKTFSLEYSGRTWTRIQAILRARQSRPDGRADRFVGQSHGHNFLPAGGAAPCEICDGKPDVPCSRTSCFASLDDSTWSRAVFARQPWQLCHIFGLNARDEHVHKLFGLRNGQLQERGFCVVPEFTPVESPAREAEPTDALIPNHA